MAHNRPISVSLERRLFQQAVQLYSETDAYQGESVFANWRYKPIVVVTKAQLYECNFISYIVRRTFSFRITPIGPMDGIYFYSKDRVSLPVSASRELLFAESGSYLSAFECILLLETEKVG